MALGREQDQRGHVGGQVQQLGGHRSVQEIVAQHAHEEKHEETARAGAEEAVVETDGHADGAGRQGFTPCSQARRVVAPQVLTRQGVDQQRHQHQRQQFAQEIGGNQRHHPGAGERADESRERRRQHGTPAHLHAAAVLPRGDARAPDGGTLVGAHQRGRRRGGKRGEQGGQQDQAAPADDCVHEAGQQRGQRDDDPFHGRDCRTATATESVAACAQPAGAGATFAESLDK